MALSADGSNRLPRVYLDPLISFHISLLMLPTGDASTILALDAKQQKKEEAMNHFGMVHVNNRQAGRLIKQTKFSANENLANLWLWLVCLLGNLNYFSALPAPNKIKSQNISVLIRRNQCLSRKHNNFTA